MEKRKIDTECQRLVCALNLIPGIETLSSCCGHGSHEFYVFFCISGTGGLDFLVSTLGSNNMDWSVQVYFGNRKSNGDGTMFYLATTSVGDEAYAAADSLATALRDRILGSYWVIEGVPVKIVED
jgi:hypothetical protein